MEAARQLPEPLVAGHGSIATYRRLGIQHRDRPRSATGITGKVLDAMRRHDEADELRRSPDETGI